MICPKCNAKNTEGTRFCSQCGAALPERDEFDMKTGMQAVPSTMSGMKTSMGVENIELKLAKGSVFAGRYEILNDGFKGGMGMVFKVKDTMLNDIKALKLILPAYLENEKTVSRFKQEVATTQKLVHENIVRVYDIGESDGVLYFTMEWIGGISLRDYISERKKQNNRLSLDEAKSLIAQVCSAISYAHKTFSIIHRDIKPENLLITDPFAMNAKIRIADFGIAKTESQAIHYSVSAYMGTPIYMAPEQYTDAAHADKRADIYSIGAILYELLTFMHPLGTFQMPSEVNPALPKKVDDIIRKALSADRTKRYDDAMDILKDLDAATVWEKSAAQQVKPEETSPRPMQQAQPAKPEKRSSMMIAAVGIIVIIAAVVVYKVFLQNKAPMGQETAKSSVQVSEVSPGASVARHAEPTKQGETIMEIGVFYEGKDGRLLPIKDGVTLHSKDNYAIYFKPKETSYLYIFQVDAKGEAFKLFPNEEEYKTINNPLKAGRAHWIPAEGKFFFLDETVGKEEIFFFVSSKPIQQLEKVKTTSRMVMDDTVKLMGVGGTTESSVTVQVATKGETIPFDMARTKMNSEGNLVYSAWFWHKS